MSRYTLKCQSCSMQIKMNNVAELIALYMTHTIVNHWELVYELHLNPHLGSQAIDLAYEQGYMKDQVIDP